MKTAAEIKEAIIEKTGIDEVVYALAHYEAYERYIAATVPAANADTYRKNPGFRAWYCRCQEAAERTFLNFPHQDYYQEWIQALDKMQGFYPTSRIDKKIQSFTI